MKMSTCRLGISVAAMVTGLALSSASSLGQEASMKFPIVRPKAPSAVTLPDPNDPKEVAAREFNKRKKEAGLEIARIRAKHFREGLRMDIRQAGISKLRQLTDPPALAAMTEELALEEASVREAVLDHLSKVGTPEADAILAWTAIYDKSEDYRAKAAELLGARVRALKSAGGAGTEVPIPVQNVIAAALESDKPEVAAAGGKLAGITDLIDAIPMMVAAQAGARGGGTGGGGGGGPDNTNESLAYIVIGTQRSYIADLTPVTGESAVGFDPQVGVITEGVVLRVINAFVITYNVGLHNSLVDLSSRAWGQPTAQLGWDHDKWAAWYNGEFKQHLARKAEAEAAERELAAKAEAKDAKDRAARDGK